MLKDSIFSLNVMGGRSRILYLGKPLIWGLVKFLAAAPWFHPAPSPGHTGSATELGSHTGKNLLTSPQALERRAMG